MGATNNFAELLAALGSQSCRVIRFRFPRHTASKDCCVLTLISPEADSSSEYQIELLRIKAPSRAERKTFL